MDELFSTSNSTKATLSNTMDEINKSNITDASASTMGTTSLDVISFSDNEVDDKDVTFLTDVSGGTFNDDKDVSFVSDVSDETPVDEKDASFVTDVADETLVDDTRDISYVSDVSDETVVDDKDASFVTDVSDETLVFDVKDVSFVTDVSDETPTEEDDTIFFELGSFPTNATSSETSSWRSAAFVLPPSVIDVRPRHSSSRDNHRRHCPSIVHDDNMDGGSYHGHHSGSGSSSPYAQLCFDPNQKTLVTMLEIDIVSGRQKHHSRMPLDAPTPDDFPWLHQDTDVSVLPAPRGHSFDGSSGGDGGSKSSISSMSNNEEKHNDEEPILLSGWMHINQDELSDEEADIYWLLNDGKDVWVQIDDGCAKALKKMWTNCSQWKLKRSTQLFSLNQQQPDDSPDARDEKRLRYSML